LMIAALALFLFIVANLSLFLEAKDSKSNEF